MRVSTTALFLLLALTVAPALHAADAPAPPAPSDAKLTATEVAPWREDLAFMATEMERRHKHLFHTTTRDAFAAQVAALDRALPDGGRHDAIVGLMRLAASVGDGHTNVSPL